MNPSRDAERENKFPGNVIFMNWLLFWLLTVIFLCIVEIFTFQLVAVWPAIAGVGALLAASLGLPPVPQFVIFIVISAVLLMATRPMVKRILKFRRQSFNAGRNIGRTAVVTEDIVNSESRGAARISGVTWMALSSDGSFIAKDEIVRIDAIEGTKLIVSKTGSHAEGR